ncbi:glycine betaine ABC transporter substrate-binding protein [Nocardiopsis sp. NPDC007018]|uniref:glycine betaine ABC transporter substrate-binding protein n=1 Tax=Nocardiopsis sp. NPDC007018 TaxID=3155721 RepID=UPI0033CD29E4
MRVGRGRGTALASAGLGGALLLSACSGGPAGGGSEAGEDLREVNIALIAWEEAVAVTHMWEAILEEKGYDVTVTEVDVAPAFQGVADGELDLYLDMWLPVTHHEYMERHRDSIESLGSWYDNAVLTLAVPEYVEDVRSIDDLPAHADALGGSIVGIEPDAGLTQVTRDQAMPLYGLDEGFELETSSGAGMMERLDGAIAEERPVVVTLWRPHPAYAQYDLRDLEDPQGGMGGTEGLHSIGRAGFGEDYPELAGWLRDWTMDDDELASLEALTVGPGVDDPAAGAREWLSQNPLFLERTLMDAAEGLEF